MQIRRFDTLEAFNEAVARAREAARAYYDGDGTVLMDDAEYDELIASIVAAAAVNGWDAGDVVGTVAAGVSRGGDVVHSERMLSLDNVFSGEALHGWVQRLEGLVGATPTLTVEPKMDGLALAVRYVNGVCTQAITRGDGSTGEDVTAQVRGSVGLPATLPLPVTVEVRGECLFTHKQFEEANTARVAAGKKAFVNARNAVAGQVRAWKQTESPAQFTFAAYATVEALDGCETHTAVMARLQDWGFTPAAAYLGQVRSFTSVEDAVEAVARVGELRGKLPFDIDGAVVKADRFTDRDAAGTTSAFPRWAIAYKFPADTRLTTIKAVVADVGRTGSVTPTAVLEPVFVGGTNVTRVTLHNPSDIERRFGGPLRLPAQVIVRRAGDVIPEIVGYGPDGPAADAVTWTMPESCPRCGQDLDRSEARWRCVNRECSTDAWLLYFASREAMDIEGLGETLVAQLVDRNLVRTPADFYRLTVEQVAALDRMGAASASKVIAAIAGSKNRPLEKFLTGLGLRHTGRRISTRLAKHFRTLGAVRAASVAELAEVDKIGEKKAAVIAGELRTLSAAIDALLAAGCVPAPVVDGPAVAEGGPLAGMSVLVTGNVPGMTRDGAQAAVERLGGKPVSSVSSKTDLVVIGDKAGASKLEKVAALGIRTMTGSEFAQLATGAA